VSGTGNAGLGRGLYFVDVLACLLFCLTLALVGARFDRERTVAVELPELRRSAATGADLVAATVTLRSSGDELSILLDDEELSVGELRKRWAELPPPAVVLRAEDSPLGRIVALAHEVGVEQIQLAYELAPETRR
jgi:biopolymer transport protein ExbD